MSLPKTPIKGDPETRRFLEALRQQVADTANNALTVNDLRSNGFFANNGIDVGGETPEVQAPTVPTSLAAEGAFENIILTWDYAEYTGHNNSRIYRSLTNVFADAEVLANVEGRVYADLVGGGKTYYYWVSNVNVNNIESATSQASGVQGVTLPDTQFILDTLTNSITESQLFSTLGARINLIDGASTLTGSVNARLNAVQTDLQSQITANGSAIVSVQDVNASQATQITSLGTRTGDAESNIVNLQSTTSSQAISLSSLTTRTGVAESNITNLQTTTSNQATSISSLTTRVGSAESNITNLQTTTSNQATSISSLTTRVGSAETNITNLNTTTSNQATSISNLTSTVNGNTTSIQTLTTTTNGLSGQYTVKIDTNGYVSGFGLASTANNATPFSDFIVRADRFSISSPAGPSIAPVTPFIVTTTTSVIDGTTVPAGVYIKSATILDGAITTAKIKDLAVDDAKIVSLDAEKITTGLLDAARITVDGVSMDTYYDASIGRNRLFIRDLGVSNGKIADLAVDTLKIAGNAVTQTLIFTVPDIYVVDGISTSGGGTEITYTLVGYGNGDYERYFDGYEGYYYVYVGEGNGSYVQTLTPIPYTVSGGYQVVETPVITVGDAVSGALIVVFYATIDSSVAKDGGQFIVLQVSVDGGDYQTVFETKVGARTNSGADTYSVMPVAVPWSIPLAQTVRVRVYTGNRHISNVPDSTTNPTYMRNIHLSLLGAKR